MHRLPQTIFEWFQRHAKTLDLLGEYAHAVYARWNDYLWGELLAAPILIWWMFGTPPMWIVVSASVWALLIAGYYTWRADYPTPQITLRFENRDPFAQMTPVAGPDVKLRKYFRVFPDCLKPVEKCEGYLLAVFQEVDGRWNPTPFNEAVPLTWADGNAGPITIEPGIGPYLRVFYVDSFEKEIVPCLAHPTPRTSIVFRERLEMPRATFRFDIKVTNGTRISLKVKMDERSSYWDRPLIELLPDDENTSKRTGSLASLSDS